MTETEYEQLANLAQTVLELSKALELCHEEWKSEYMSCCIEYGYSNLADEAKTETTQKWIDLAKEQLKEQA